MTLSNKLTLSRVFIGPVFFIIHYLAFHYLNKGPASHATAGALFGVGLALIVYSEISDAIDGFLARRRNETTDFGKLFDPYADSLSRFTFFLAFWQADLMDSWMILLIFYRDATVSFIRILAGKQQVIVSARRSGKLKAMFQAIAIHVIVISEIVKTFWSPMPLTTISWTAMLIVTCVTVISAFDYWFGNAHIISKISK